MTPGDATRALFGAQAAGAQRVLDATSSQSALTGADKLARSWKRIEQLGIPRQISRSTQQRLWMAVDSELTRDTLELLDRVAPAVGGAFHTHFTPFVQAAINDWPVRTGLSRSLLVPSIRPDAPGVVLGELIGGAPYTLIMKWGKPKTVRAQRTGAQRRKAAKAPVIFRPAMLAGGLPVVGLGKGFRPGESVWWSLVRRPHAALADRMARTIQEALDGGR